MKGKPFRSFEAFARHRLWEGLNCTIDDLLAFCRKRDDVRTMVLREVEQLPAHGEVGGGHSRDDNIISASAHGTSATYTLKRLKRDRPDLAERVASGELSANAAAIEAGFRKKPSPFEQVKKLIPKLSAAEKRKLKSVEGSIMWWIGDWVRFGERRWGDRYKEAEEVTGRSYGVLAQAKYVADKYDFSSRLENLDWTHHQEMLA